jgi:hypothetical protein
MTGLVRKATLLAVCGLLVVAATAVAGVPNPANCTVPTFVKVVGYGGATPDARGTISVTVRDIGNFPVANSLVVVDFIGAPDVKLCDTQPQGMDCVASPTQKDVWARTDLNGVATFTIIGAATNIGASAGAGAGGVIIKADYINIGVATAVVFDENGAITGNGVTSADFVSLLKDWGSGTYYGRSDFDLSGPPIITAADFVPWLKCWGDGSSVNGCTSTYCAQ